MTSSLDTIVIGLGGIGSAITYELAKRGQSVLGLEQYDLVHSKGSSFGDSRIFRYSQFAGPEYVPLAIRAKELWGNLEDQFSDERLFFQTGGLDAGPEYGSIFPGALKSCTENQLSHEVFSPKEAMKRFPAFQFPDHFHCLYQEDAGFLVPERGVAAHLNGALHHGAAIHARETVTDIDLKTERVCVTTNKRTYEAETLVLAGGPWTGEILPALKGILTPERGCVGWFEPTSNAQNFSYGEMPIFIIDDGRESFYGFPKFGRPGFKIGGNIHRSEYGTAEGLRRGVNEDDEQRMREFLQPFFPNGNGPLLAASDCVWTLTPDEHFILDTHPDYSNVSIAAGFSGYGYKFCPVIGEIMADFAMGQTSKFDINLHRLSRFNI